VTRQNFGRIKYRNCNPSWKSFGLFHMTLKIVSGGTWNYV
jgi:hypothetical protein